ncbi:MAG: surface carbohydrate biosynthesis protein [Steroidobacteraceae bacterium]
MTRAPSTLIIPVENQVRELDAKLLLACVAAERGVPVVLGSRTYIHFAMPSLPRGLFLAKSMRSISKRMLNIIRGLGHDVVAWDEESLVRYRSPEYYAWRYSEDTFKVIDQVFAWGADDAEFFSAYPGYSGAPLHVTGNPRIDLLRPEVRGYFAAEVEALKRRYGEFILINTNFSFVNNFVPALNLILRDGQGQPRVSRTGWGMSLPFALGMAGHQQAIYEHFRELMPQLSGWFPQHRIVLRPHPSENHAVWRQILAGCPQVEVAHEGNVVPWLMAAKVLLHNGCTTAVEASVLETPAVSYMPVTSETYDYHLPNGLSHGAHTPAAVRELLGEILAGRRGMVDPAVRERLFNRHLAATRGPLACDRVLDVLLASGYGERATPRPAAATWFKAWVAGNYRTLGKRINGLLPNHRNSPAYHSHRFPNITASELNDRIARFRSQLKRFGSVRAEARSPYVFRIHDPEAATRFATSQSRQVAFAPDIEPAGASQ